MMVMMMLTMPECAGWWQYAAAAAVAGLRRTLLHCQHYCYQEQ
jgi:hypothetical protein